METIKNNYPPEPASPDNGADKSGSDCNCDKTHKNTNKNKFDKPAREVDPDRTGIDTKADKTKKKEIKN